MYLLIVLGAWAVFCLLGFFVYWGIEFIIFKGLEKDFQRFSYRTLLGGTSSIAASGLYALGVSAVMVHWKQLGMQIAWGPPAISIVAITIAYIIMAYCTVKTTFDSQLEAQRIEQDEELRDTKEQLQQCKKTIERKDDFLRMAVPIAQMKEGVPEELQETVDMLEEFFFGEGGGGD